MTGVATSVPSRAILPPSPETQFEIFGRHKFVGSCSVEENLQSLDDEFCRHSRQDAFSVEVSEPGDAPPLVNWINSCVRYGHSGWEDFLIVSENFELLTHIRTLQSALRIGLILNAPEKLKDLDSLVGSLRSLGVDCVLASLNSLTDGLMARNHFPGLNVYLRSADCVSEVSYALALGADGVVIDHPDRFRAAFSSFTGRPQTIKAPSEVPFMVQEELFPAG